MIDELIRHCIEQIGYDGEAGTELDRLQQFIHDFHLAQTRQNGSPPQKIDDAYRAFVFRNLMASPDVHVGSHVPGVVPDTNAKGTITRKRERGGIGTMSEEVVLPALEWDWVDLVPDHQARASSLDLLQQIHGANLRIVLTASVTRRMLTGSSELNFTASNYKFLQLVCRSRQNAIKSTDLGAQMRYDQKTIFYLAKRAIDAGLVTKLKARETGTQASYFVATKFLDKCPLWLRQKEAEHSNSERPGLYGRTTSTAIKTEIEQEHLPPASSKQEEGDDDAEPDLDPDVDVEGEEADADADEAVDGPSFSLNESDTSPASAHFEPLDPETTSIWLSTRTDLARLRLYKMLDATTAKVAVRIGLLNRLGLSYSHRLKRAFQLFLEKLVVSGHVEVVKLVTTESTSAVPGKGFKRGIRMTEKGAQEMLDLMRGQSFDTVQTERDQRAASRRAALERELRMREPKLIREATLDRQAYEVAASSGSSGVTVRRLQNAFNGTGGFSRTIESILNRSAEAKDEASMGDLTMRQFSEYKGRKRRIRIYSHHAWVLQATNEQIATEQDTAVLEAAGGFPEIDEACFYTDTKDAIAKALSLAPDVFIENGGHPSNVLRTPLQAGVDGSPTASRPKIGRPKGTLNKKTIERLKREEAQARADGDANSLEQREGPAGIESPGATASARGGLREAEAPSTPVPTAAKRRKTEKGRVDMAQDTPNETASQASETTPLDGVNYSASLSPNGQIAVIAGEGAELQPSDAAVNANPPPDVQALASRSTDAPQLPAPITPQRTGHSTPRARARASAVKGESQTLSEKKARSNVTEIRSTIALLECLEELGGALDVLLLAQELAAFVERNKSRHDAHVLNLREKRVRDKVIARAMDQGKLKRTFVRVARPDSHPQRTIVYLPSVAPAVLQKYCDAVTRGEKGWTHVNEGSSIMNKMTDRVRLQADDMQHLSLLRPWQNDGKLEAETFETDPGLAERMRAEFLAHGKIMQQFFGHPPGSVARLMLFHLACINAINAGASHRVRQIPSPTIDISYFWTEAPLDLFLSINGLARYSVDVESAYLDPQTRQWPLSQLAPETRQALGLASHGDAPPRTEVQTAIYSLAAQLTSMSVLRPVQTEASNSVLGSLPLPSITFEIEGRVPVYDWSTKGTIKPVLLVADGGLSLRAARIFWHATSRVCSGKSLRSREGLEPAEGFEPNRITKGITPDLLNRKAWRTVHSARPVQKKFLLRFLHGEEALPPDDLAQLASHISLLPVPIVKRVWSLGLKLMYELHSGQRRNHSLGFISWPLEIHGIEINNLEPAKVRTKASIEKRGRLSTLRKARELRDKRLQAFEEALEEAMRLAPAAEPYRDKVERLLRSFRKKYVESHPGFTFDEARQAIQRVIGGAAGVRVKLPPVRRIRDGEDRIDQGEGAERRVEDEDDEDGENGEESGQPVAVESAALSRGAVTPRGRRGRAKTTNSTRGGRKSKAATTRKRRERAAEAGGNGTEGRRRKSSRRSAVATTYWTPQRNELLRDATVILRARDRFRGRSDWSAITQLVDESEMQSKTVTVIIRQWRTQWTHIRDDYGEEGYLNALERQWTAIAREARLSGELPDPSFPSATNFNLRDQVEFLRARIDKNAIYTSLERSSRENPLPLDLAAHDFTRDWEEEYRSAPPETKFEEFFTLDAGNVQKRFELLLNSALVLETPSAALPSRDSAAQDDYVAQLHKELAESAVRMVILSDDQRFSETDKSAFCERFGEDEIESAVVRLLDAKIIRPTSSEVIQRRKPGTNFVLTEEFIKPLEQRSESSESNDLQQTLARLDAKLAQSVSTPLYVEPVTTDGEAECLATLLSADRLEAQIDVTPFANLREHHAFNARVLNDDELETLVSVALTPEGLQAARRAPLCRLPDPPVQTRRHGHKACETAAEEDETRWSRTLASASPHDLPGLHQVRHLLNEAGPRGIDLSTSLLHISAPILPLLLAHTDPPAFVTGMHSIVLVSTRFFEPHSLPVLIDGANPDRDVRIVPRLWNDLRGTPLRSVWRKALVQVAETCVHRPGVSLLALVERFRPVLGAGEVFELVQALVATDRFEIRWSYVEEVGTVVGSVHAKGSEIWAGFVEDEV